MKRRCGGRSIPAAESNRTLPSNTIRPVSGRIRPAIHLSVMLLPEPELPNRPSVPSSTANADSSVKSGSFFVISTDKLMDYLLTPFFRLGFSNRLTASKTTIEIARLIKTHFCAPLSSPIRHSW